jgi:hypothetical protein
MARAGQAAIPLVLGVLIAGCRDPGAPSALARDGANAVTSSRMVVNLVDSLAALPLRVVVRDAQRLPIQIHVRLANATISLSNVSVPYVGNATIVGSQGIQYVPGPSFAGQDFLVYNVSGLGPTSVPRLVVIQAPDSTSQYPSSIRVVRQAVRVPVESRDEFLGAPVGSLRLLALQPLAQAILRDYGNPQTPLDEARAIRDWVARTAIHPYYVFHDAGTTANATVLPPGVSWADVNHVNDPNEPAGAAKSDADSRFWAALLPDGYAMLEALLGTLDPLTGERADDGMMQHVQSAQYRIRDITTYHYVLCTYQDYIAIALWGALGLHGMQLSTIGHDPAAVFIPELGKWVYMDPTYNEDFTVGVGGRPLSPVELMTLSRAGETSMVRPVKRGGPWWSQDVYIDPSAHSRATYFGDNHPQGMVVMAAQLDDVSAMRLVVVDVPEVDQYWPLSNREWYDRVPPAVAFPQLGVVIAGVDWANSGYDVRLDSTFPAVRFQRSIAGGAWEDVPRVDRLPSAREYGTPYAVAYRSVDALGYAGMSASISVSYLCDPGFTSGAPSVTAGVC